MRKEYKDILARYLPEGSLDTVCDWIKTYRVHLRISKNRTTKLGDYRPPQQTGIHKISVNHNLNPYAFLITFTHELAHLIVWEKHKNLAKPHGKEWKKEFNTLIGNFIGKNIFPEDVERALSRHFVRTTASSSSDNNLSSVLMKYDKNPQLLLKDLPDGSIFSIHNGKTFKKIEKLRKRYRCLCLDDKRMYFVNPLVPVNISK